MQTRPLRISTMPGRGIAFDGPARIVARVMAAAAERIVAASIAGRLSRRRSAAAGRARRQDCLFGCLRSLGDLT